LDVDPAGKFVVSGAWDMEARIWPVGKWHTEAVLKGHEGSVWAVLAYDSETIITACADKLIRVCDFFLTDACFESTLCH
jgi:phospholipase A-2-activating protein